MYGTVKYTWFGTKSVCVTNSPARRVMYNVVFCDKGKLTDNPYIITFMSCWDNSAMNFVKWLKYKIGVTQKPFSLELLMYSYSKDL